MNCPNCGTALPDGAKFCFSCGGALGAPAPPPPAAPAPLAPAGAQEIKCPACGAPVHPVFGEMVITCDYCGSCVTLGGGGWKEINKHTMLLPKVGSPEAALRIVHDFLDVGLLHRKAFEESKVAEQRLSFVPFWVMPVSASTSYVYQDVALAVGSTVGTMVAAEVLGSALSGNRGGGFIAVPFMTGPVVNSNRQETLTGVFEFPVVAVKGMTAYQPKNYEFGLRERTFFDKKQVPQGAPILNGDLGEDAAHHAAQSYVTQLQSEQAHKKHHMVSQLRSQVEVSEGELLHVPIWYFRFDRKGQQTALLIDAHAGRVMQTIG
jgi:hypothetical protein